jgi:hypothetical protein
MNRHRRLVLAIAVAVAAAGDAAAQPARFSYTGGNPGWMDVEMLLQNASVIKELKLEDTRSMQARQALFGALAKYTPQIAKVFKLPKDQQKARELELLDRYQQDQYQALAKVLTADQLKRLKQIQVRVAGVDAFAQPWVQKDLALTGKQKEAIQEIAKEYAEARKKDDAAFDEVVGKVLQPEQLKSLRLFRDAGSGPDAVNQPELQGLLRLTADQKDKLKALAKDMGEARQRQERLEAETLSKAADVLMTAQRKRWDELAGKPFHLEVRIGNRPPIP